MKGKPVPGFSHGSGAAWRTVTSRSLPPTPVGDSAARERSPVRPSIEWLLSVLREVHRLLQHAAQQGSVGQQTGGSGGGTTTDLMVRSLEKVMQQLQGMSNHAVRGIEAHQREATDGNWTTLLTGFTGLERAV